TFTCHSIHALVTWPSINVSFTYYQHFNVFPTSLPCSRLRSLSPSFTFSGSNSQPLICHCRLIFPSRHFLFQTHREKRTATLLMGDFKQCILQSVTTKC